jgi:hypothetical protein
MAARQALDFDKIAVAKVRDASGVEGLHRTLCCRFILIMSAVYGRMSTGIGTRHCGDQSPEPAIDVTKEAWKGGPEMADDSPVEIKQVGIGVPTPSGQAVRQFNFLSV